jgi:hypothetical protein
MHVTREKDLVSKLRTRRVIPLLDSDGDRQSERGAYAVILARRGRFAYIFPSTVVSAAQH